MKKIQTWSDALIMVRKGTAGTLGCIPMELRTRDLCRLAVKRNGLALKFVLDCRKTKRMCMDAVRGNGMSLEYVPACYMTNWTCLVAVQQNGMALEHVPEGMKTQRICRAAVKADGNALMWVPYKLRSPSLCHLAMKSVGYDLVDDIPEHIQAAVKARADLSQGQASLGYGFLPEQRAETKEMSLSALQRDKNASMDARA